MIAYILLAVFYSNSVQGPLASLSAEFQDRAACEAALGIIRQQMQSRSAVPIVLTCTPKGSK